MGRMLRGYCRIQRSGFKGLKGNAARAMWQMLIERGAELKLTHSNVKTNDTEGSADWVAVYPFVKQEEQFTNHIHATFQFKDGKIINHKKTEV